MKDSSVSFLADKLHDLEENGPKQLYGVYAGVVMPFPDVPPVGMFQGRIKVKLSTIDPLEPIEAWARVAVPMAGLTYGTYFIPTPGTEVLVAFENGDVGSPYVIGSLWNATALPPISLPETQIRMIRTPTGNQIVFTETPPTVTIQSGPTSPVPIPTPPLPLPPAPPTVLLAPDGVTITSPVKITLAVGSSSITLMPEGILIFGAEVSLTAGAQATIAAGMVRINS
jgi:Type VI secretion system/phage-baseplate injector OB domain